MRFRSDLAALLSSIILLLAGTQAYSETVESLFNNPDFCQKPVNKENSGKVIAGCTAIIDGETVDRNELGRAHFMRGWGFYKSAEKLKAADDFRTVLTLTPESEKNHREAINWLAAIKSEIANGCDQPPYDELKPETAIPACSSAIAAKHLFRKNEIATMYFRRGRAYSKRGELALALHDYDDALSLEPGWTDAHNNRGSILRKQDKFEQAVAAFDKAIAIDPDYWRAHYNRGSVHEANQDYSRAFTDYRSVVRLLKPGDFTKQLEEKIAKFGSETAASQSKTVDNPDNRTADVQRQLDQLQKELARTKALVANGVMSKQRIVEIEREIARLTGGTPPDEPGSTVANKPEAHPQTGNPTSLPADERRVALVIGNSEYTGTTRLPNPKNDAELIAQSLRTVGFQVNLVIDADQKTMKRAMLDFGRDLRENATTGLFYYAGHGVQVRGRNYLIPVDAAISAEDEIDLEGIDVNDFLRVMNRSKSRVNIVVLDACRNNPFARSFRSTGGNAGDGLAPVQAPKGTYIAYATAPRQVALDGENAANSPYTAALIQAILEPGLSLERVFKRTRAKVLETTDDQQVPWETSSITGEFFFKPVK